MINLAPFTCLQTPFIYTILKLFEYNNVLGVNSKGDMSFQFPNNSLR